MQNNLQVPPVMDSTQLAYVWDHHPNYPITQFLKGGDQRTYEEQLVYDYNYSRPFDFLLYSNNKRLNKALDTIIDDLLSDTRYRKHKNKYRTHLKLIMLNLYDAWSNDPQLCITYSRDASHYQPGTWNYKYNLTYKIQTSAQAYTGLSITI